jgi:hypothetical protein
MTKYFLIFLLLFCSCRSYFYPRPKQLENVTHETLYSATVYIVTPANGRRFVVINGQNVRFYIDNDTIRKWWIHPALTKRIYRTRK